MTFEKNAFADFRHTARYGDAGQTRAVFERTRADFRHAVWDDDGGQTRAA